MLIILKILAAWTAISVVGTFAMAPALSRRLRDINFPRMTSRRTRARQEAAGSVERAVAQCWGSCSEPIYHAEGVQIDECSLDAGRKTWRLREPIASLIDEGETVRRQYAGPVKRSPKAVE